MTSENINKGEIMNNIVVKIENKEGQLVVSSRVIAEQLGKRHDNVMRDLDKILENSNLSSLIIPSTYSVQGQKRVYKEYLLTQDGFTLYMFNIQGYNDYKLAYINAFNKMKTQLDSISNKDRLLLNIIKAKDDTSKAIALSEYENSYVKPLESKAEYYDEVFDTSSCYTVSTIAKDLGMSAKKLNKILCLEDIQYKRGSMYFLYAKYQDKGYTDVRTATKDNKSYTSTVWTELGREFIYKFLKNKKYI